ncbi:ATP-binding cassette domain-containing protein [Acetobacterium woodii]|uniref:ABC transport system ATP-binding protein n=1 Tax=Acetobacterium woodii (strain ATCC 29683 / DSM 1030 / JCM 2381 / KCTC 1655 / WB1) TaxID=931626 RepID=H6LFW1_ACEWD|nr:ABC transporter ATP-binding protein [Acetobacterium woodii]AFA48249.1 ABC transport system ATP-binding protein [Acetobacterium woodii DSM 1030]
MKIEDLIILLDSQNLNKVIEDYPITADFLANYRLNAISKDQPIKAALVEVEEEMLEEFGLDRYDLTQQLALFLSAFSQSETAINQVSSITINGGWNKFKESENISLTVYAGEIISIVGPTGSGKSRLLNDIECLAQKDTPTRRQILVNGEAVDEIGRFEMVAQLSQNMNFVMDLTVREFLEMHAKCRLLPDINTVVEKSFECANQLAGERFSEATKVTQLSGGQSRALMIADTAFMSDSPIVLIDEIENAGIDRKQALLILSKREKIIFISTHDPLLALSANKRIVIKNGGIAQIIVTTDEEKNNLEAIEKVDNALQKLRNSLRQGELITEELLIG